MMKFLKGFIKEEDGVNTVEIVLILAILVGLALIFKDKITTFVTNILNKVTGENIEDEFTKDINE